MICTPPSFAWRRACVASRHGPSRRRGEAEAWQRGRRSRHCALWSALRSKRDRARSAWRLRWRLRGRFRIRRLGRRAAASRPPQRPGGLARLCDMGAAPRRNALDSARALLLGGDSRAGHLGRGGSSLGARLRRRPRSYAGRPSESSHSFSHRTRYPAPTDLLSRCDRHEPLPEAYASAKPVGRLLAVQTHPCAGSRAARTVPRCARCWPRCMSVAQPNRLSPTLAA